jgi:hypothetical protein
MIVTVTVEFESEALKTKSGLNASVSASVAKVATDLSMAMEKTGTKAKISVSAFQEGGNSEAIFSALGGDSATCYPDDVKKCDDMIKKAIDYAANSFSA